MMIRTHASLVAPLTALLFAFDASVADQADGWIGFDGSRGHVVLDIKVNGVPASAILDTGADTATISASLAERAGIELNQNRRTRIVGVHGQQEVPTSGRFTLELADTSVEVDALPVTPLDGFDLVVGRAMFEWAVVQIDYPNHRIRFLRPEVVDFDGNVKFRATKRGAPMIRGRLAGKNSWMLLDTGNAGPTLLKRKFVLRNDLDAHRAEDLVITGRGAIRRGSRHLLSVPRFHLGPFEFESLLATYSTRRNDGFDAERTLHGSRLRTDRVSYDGILGYDVLRNFVVTMDLKRGRVHLATP